MFDNGIHGDNKAIEKKQKTCKYCSETKELRFFYVDSASSDGRRNYCRGCKGTITKIKEQEGAARRQITRSTHEHLNCLSCSRDLPFSMFNEDNTGLTGYRRNCRECLWKKNILNRVRSGARKRGLEFSITMEDVIVPTHCPLLGIPLNKTSHNNQDSPSIDRIDSSKGYVPGNVWVISWRANDIKRNATLEEFTTIARNWASNDISGYRKPRGFEVHPTLNPNIRAKHGVLDGQ